MNMRATKSNLLQAWVPIKRPAPKIKNQDENNDEAATEQKVEDNSAQFGPIVSNNYVIVRNILKYLDWQGLANCFYVCKLWKEIASTLSVQPIASYDFSLQNKPNNVTLFESDKSVRSLPPLAVLVFCSVYTSAIKCSQIPENPCDPPCDEAHNVLDIIETKYSYPKDCMVTTLASHLIYYPLPASATCVNTTKTFSSTKTKYHGLVLPHIPNVNFHVLECKIYQGTNDAIFFNKLHYILSHEIVKGVIFLVNEDFDDLEKTIELIGSTIKVAQPDVRLAMAGCFVDGAVLNLDESIPYIFTMLSVLIFTVDRPKVSETEFEVCSLKIPQSVVKKNKIQAKIKEFASVVPNHKFSAAVRFSCVGRNRQHSIESEAYRSCFPTTPFIGCFGNGEMAWENPETSSEQPPTKKSRTILSFATVFLHFCWGPKLS